MKTQKVDIEGKTYELREISYIEALELDGLTKAEAAKKILGFATGLKQEEISKIDVKTGIELNKAIMDLIKHDPLPQPTEEQKQN
jgi:hypothetical protein